MRRKGVTKKVTYTQGKCILCGKPDSDRVFVTIWGAEGPRANEPLTMPLPVCSPCIARPYATALGTLDDLIKSIEEE